MAMINQLKKQLETSTKRVAQYESRIKMYSERLIKALEKATKKLGFTISINNYKELPNIGQHWDLYFSISNAIDYKAENEKDLERELKTRESLKAQIAQIERDLNDKKPLENALRSAMADFRTVWFEKMIDWYDNHYNQLRSILGANLNRRERAKAARDYFETRHRWNEYRKVKAYLTGVIKSCNEVILDDANQMDKPAYLVKVREDLEKVWEMGIVKLADKCRKYGLNEGKIKASNPNVTEKGFEVLLTDGGPRVIDARVIWAAEYSVYVSPHTRYIVTKREQ